MYIYHICYIQNKLYKDVHGLTMCTNMHKPITYLLKQCMVTYIDCTINVF